MNIGDFKEKYLHAGYSEFDLQQLVKAHISSHGIVCRDEVRIKTPATTRRSDLETWRLRIELKRELTYENIKSALGQLYLYDHYGSKILGFIPKQKVIMGVSPIERGELEAARKLAKDIRGMGVRVVFLDEEPRWLERSRFKFDLIGLIGLALVAFVAAFVLASL